MTVSAMPVSHPKQVKRTLLIQIRTENIRILIFLLQILRREIGPRRIGKFLDDVVGRGHVGHFELGGGLAGWGLGLWLLFYHYFWVEGYCRCFVRFCGLI